MADNSLRAELEVQRCLIEKQQVEIQRLFRHVEVQFQHSADMQAQLDKLTQPPTPVHQPRPQGNRNGNRNGHGHDAKPLDGQATAAEAETDSI
jgi:hypothetical protein